MRYLLTLEYDGAAYAGWQRQKNAVTVQEKVETALQTLLGVKTVVYASGRTDAGVHAAGQAAHFDSERVLDKERFRYSLNALLPDDVKAVALREVSSDFHAQYSAKKKTYSYRLYLSRTPSPLRRSRYCRITPPFDTEKFLAVLALFEGEHDFKAFGNTGSGVKTTVRRVYSARAEIAGDEITVFVTGNGFLYNMVRVMAGCAVAAGKGKIGVDDVKAMFSTGERARGIKTLPANALTLENVEYGLEPIGV